MPPSHEADLESTTYGLRALHQHKRLGEFFEHMWGPESDGALRKGHGTHANRKQQILTYIALVMEMGTGLGVALLAQFGTEYRVYYF